MHGRNFASVGYPESQCNRREGVAPVIPESEIARECSAKATIARAREIAKSGKLIFDRQCSYKVRMTVLSACVTSSSWIEDYDVQVWLDESRGSIIGYDCTCPAFRKYYGMCKHVAALALTFNKNPMSFVGYGIGKETRTAPSITGFMKRKAPSKLAPRLMDEKIPARSVSLEPTLEPLVDSRWSVNFKVAAGNSRYALKDISSFLDDIDRCCWHEYGKKLAFTHAEDMFTEQAWKVVQWMRHIDGSGVEWWNERRYSYGSSRRTMYVTDSQIAELFDLFVGCKIFMVLRDFRTYQRSKPVHLEVVDEDPFIDMEIVSLKEGGYRLNRSVGLEFVVAGDRVYAYDSQCLYRCSDKLGACRDFLEEVYLSSDDSLTVSEADAPLFCKTILPMLQDALDVAVPSEMEAMRPVEGRLEFYLDIVGGNGECKAKVCYGETTYNLFIPGGEKGGPARDEVLEASARATVRRYLPAFDEEENVAYTVDDDDLAELLFHGAGELRRLGEVFVTEAFKRRRLDRRPSVQVGLSVKSKLVNFTVRAEDMTPVEIASLLSSYRAKKKYHRFKDGSFASLEDDSLTADLERLDTIAQELDMSSRELATGEMEVAPYHAFLLDSLVDDAEKENSFRKFVSAFEDGRGQHHELPEGLEGVLRPYQVEGFNWLSMLADTGLAGILADEMGLGKSLQVISFLLGRQAELDGAPAMIVCPASLVYNWQAEFRKFAPGMRVSLLAGTRAQRDAIRAKGGYQVLVTSYDTLRIDISSFDGMSFSCQVIDEAQMIKNHNTKVARAVKEVRAGYRIALTGTPIENRLSELWSIFDYLMPGMLGPYKRFRERYEAPIIAGDEEVSARLSAKVGPFILRRLKKDVLADLPDKLETSVRVKLEGEQLKLYTAHEARLRHALAEGDDDSIREGKIAVLAELTRLRQLCCDPRLLYDNAKKHGAKLGAIVELVQAAQDSGNKVLIFSQFVSFLGLIGDELAARGWAYHVITGSTPKKKRLELVDRFNSDDVPVFLISLKAGGTGLNLTGASVVIHADPWWNVAAQNQATDRAHRIGQTQDVSVFKVIADSTIEERILELQEAKSNLADAVLAADGTSLASLDRDELISLLGGD